MPPPHPSAPCSQGPVTHADALCPHDGVDVFNAERSVHATHQCFMSVPSEVWNELTSRFQQVASPVPAVSRLVECQQCRAKHAAERQALDAERAEISKLDTTKLDTSL